MAIIRSVDEFLEKVKIGTTFWCMTSYCGKPDGIAGPFEATDFSRERLKGKEFVVVYYERQLTNFEFAELEVPTFVENRCFVSDLTNRWHGVFLSEEEARAFYQAELKAFEESEERQAEYERCRRSRWRSSPGPLMDSSGRPVPRR